MPSSAMGSRDPEARFSAVLALGALVAALAIGFVPVATDVSDTGDPPAGVVGQSHLHRATR